MHQLFCWLKIANPSFSKIRSCWFRTIIPNIEEYAIGNLNSLVSKTALSLALIKYILMFEQRSDHQLSELDSYICHFIDHIAIFYTNYPKNSPAPFKSPTPHTMCPKNSKCRGKHAPLSPNSLIEMAKAYLSQT